MVQGSGQKRRGLDSYPSGGWDHMGNRIIVWLYDTGWIACQGLLLIISKMGPKTSAWAPRVVPEHDVPNGYSFREQIHTYQYVHAMRVCMYVCMYVCMHACMPWIQGWMDGWMHAYKTCTYARMHACVYIIYIYIYIYIYASPPPPRTTAPVLLR